MAGGNDPFPRDEVTGLAAFENLPQVSSLLMPDELPSELLDEERPSEPPGAPTQRAPSRREHDATLMGHASWQEPVEDTSAQDFGADHLFDDSVHSGRTSAEGSWEEDDATRVLESATAATVTTGAVPPALDMDWDEDEPATEMRPGAMFETSPLEDARAHAGQGSRSADDSRMHQTERLDQTARTHAAALDDPEDDDWEDPDAGTEVYQRSMAPSFAASRASSQDFAPPLLPAATGVSASDFDAEPAAKTMSGGRPSPFPNRPLTVGARPSSAAFAALGHERPLPDQFLAALKGGHRSAWLPVAAVGFGLFALVLIVRGLGGSPAPGHVSVVTKPSDLKLLVDGKEVDGKASPFLVGELQPGTHSVVASKPGYGEYRGSFELAKGENKTLPLIELVAAETGFAIRSLPSGATVFVDGQATDQVTPARVVGVAAGMHSLQLKLDGHAPYDLKLFVPEATLLQLPAAELTALPEAAQASSERAARWGRGAKHAVDADADDDAADEPRPRRLHVRNWGWRASNPESSERETAKEKEPAPTANDAPTAVSTSSKLGTLRINSRPWAQVSVDGRLVGNTPQTALQLSAGSHKVQLVNQQMGLSKTVQIKIPAGGVVTQVLNLAD